MNQIIVSPVQWTQLPDMDAMDHEFGAGDAECLAAIRRVLEAHGKLQRFGVALLHKHFELADDECMLETVDAERRTLTVTVIRESELPQAVQTQWSLASPNPLQWCKLQCYYTGGDHTRPHQQIPNT